MSQSKHYLIRRQKSPSTKEKIDNAFARLDRLGLGAIYDQNLKLIVSLYSEWLYVKVSDDSTGWRLDSFRTEAEKS